MLTRKDIWNRGGYSGRRDPLFEKCQVLKGKVGIATVSENSKFRVVTFNNGIHGYQHKKNNKLILGGMHLGIWDTDIFEVLGIPKEVYEKLVLLKKQECDALVQLNKYIKKSLVFHSRNSYNIIGNFILEDKNVRRNPVVAEERYGRGL